MRILHRPVVFVAVIMRFDSMLVLWLAPERAVEVLYIPATCTRESDARGAESVASGRERVGPGRLTRTTGIFLLSSCSYSVFSASGVAR
mmetsp:Transcript_6562/g.17338  ORF Transcript_6562/g.17338 Transcript_6562/m.17338 type:complete len:89 (-) Transcript_6562:918-1184(-)